MPIPKANRADDLEENFRVFDFEIDGADLEALGGLNEEYSSLGIWPSV